MDDEGHHALEPGEFDEFCIGGHPRLERSAKPPWVEFPWQEVFSHLDGDPPAAPREYEAAARWLHEILVGLVSPHRGKLDLYAVAVRCVGLALALNRRDLVSPKIRRIYAQAKWRSRRKAAQAKE